MYLLARIQEKCEEKQIDFFFPITFILLIIPLIVRLKVVKVDSYTRNLFGATVETDLFSQNKSIALLVLCILLLIISFISFRKIFSKKDKIVNAILISSIVFILFTLLSSIFSKYNTVAFFGVYDRAEGFITIACYFTLLIYSIYTFKNTNNYKFLVIPIIIVVIINSFLGVFQYIGKDLITTKFASYLVIPSKYRDSVSKLDLLYEKGKLYGTLYHYNYIGSLTAMVLPILFGLTIFEKNIVKKIVLGLSSLLSLWLLFGSTSRAGIIGVCAVILFAIIIFGKLIFKKWKIILISFIAILLLSAGLNFATKGAIFEKLPGLINDATSIFKNTSNFDYTEHVPVKNITHTSKTAEIILQNDVIKISFEDNNYVFRNSDDEIIPYHIDGNNFIFDDENYSNYFFTFGTTSKSSTRADGIMLKVNNQPTFMFGLKKNNSIHLISSSTFKDIDVVFPETIGFNGKEKLGSARGYIWSRSIPLLKNNLLLGSGPDTFAFQFPQLDLIGKYYAYDTPNMIVDKPHNLYLQIALNEGLIALIAFLAIIIIYIVDSLKLYSLKKDYSKSQMLGLLTFLGVIGYLFAGLFNDSVVSVAPIFWIVLGVGIAINYINRTEIKTNTTK